MIGDILTIIWKEFRENVVNKQGMRGGWFSLVIIVLVMGVFIPWQMGKIWLTDLRQLLYWSWMPILLALSQISDSFAGERERRTLETILATRLSDRAILLGKLLYVVLYAWLITVTSLLAGAITINVAHPTGSLQFYPINNFIIGLSVSFLSALLISSIGILVSLKSSTVRQAYQRTSIFLIAFYFIPVLAIQVIPEQLKENLANMFQGLDLHSAILWIMAVIAIIDVVLLWITNKVFNRSKLLLDKK